MADDTIGEGRARERTFREEWQQGYQEGYRKGILPGIALVIEERFGNAGLALMEEIQTLTAVEQLRMLGKRLLTATNLDEVRAVYRTDGIEDVNPLAWIEIANGASYVRATLAIEAPEILDLLTSIDRWECVELPIELVQADPAMLAEHANTLSHQQRLDECLERVRLGRPLLPLILLHCERGERYLVAECVKCLETPGGNVFRELPRSLTGRHAYGGPLPPAHTPQPPASPACPPRAVDSFQQA